MTNEEIKALEELRLRHSKQLMSDFCPEGEPLTIERILNVFMASSWIVNDIAKMLWKRGVNHAAIHNALTALFKSVGDDRIVDELQRITLDEEYEMDNVHRALIATHILLAQAYGKMDVEKEGGKNEKSDQAR